MDMPDLDTASSSELHRYAAEMQQRAQQTQREVEAWSRNSTPPSPPRRSSPTIPVRVDPNVDWEQMGRQRRRAHARRLIDAELAREAEQTKQTEAEQRAAWRATSPLAQIMR